MRLAQGCNTTWAVSAAAAAAATATAEAAAAAAALPSLACCGGRVVAVAPVSVASIRFRINTARLTSLATFLPSLLSFLSPLSVLPSSLPSPPSPLLPCSPQFLPFRPRLRLPPSCLCLGPFLLDPASVEHRPPRSPSRRELAASASHLLLASHLFLAPHLVIAPSSCVRPTDPTRIAAGVVFGLGLGFGFGIPPVSATSEEPPRPLPSLSPPLAPPPARGPIAPSSSSAPSHLRSSTKHPTFSTSSPSTAFEQQQQQQQQQQHPRAPMEEPNDLAAQHEAAKDYQPALEGPPVGEKTTSDAITHEYAKADPVYVEKTVALPQTYSHYRPIQGDGNCGWRGAYSSEPSPSAELASEA
ncbi:hypothetical protein DCS_05011 [Drechmeria coniospora]|uniref:Ubiquitinyl hydrolase 1 n=1 Tax=Drechmeria coniospora TaxID=98403 RepID=A0A151GLN3_DRECN|nr:hypothetical protein DCS_05011 [Drechmeria coniospora]KYK57998.1 hypothetical protein DCS_05011 [Drechmeria coniospora]